MACFNLLQRLTLDTSAMHQTSQTKNVYQYQSISKAISKPLKYQSMSIKLIYAERNTFSKPIFLYFIFIVYQHRRTQVLIDNLATWRY